MKKTIVFIAVLLSILVVTKATDIKVNETGSNGTYTSITAALAVAVDGDRILVEPKAGNAPYIENFTITKSIQILCNAESTKFAVQGNISVAPSTVKEISIIGLDLTGNIISTIDATAAGRTIVKIMFSKFLGQIKFDNNNYDVTVANCNINGSVTLRSGRVIGNEITTDLSYGVNVTDEASGGAIAISDTIQIVGNRIYAVYNSSSTLINITSLKYFYQISNNFLYYSYKGINITGWSSNVNGNHEIINNTIKRMNYNTTSYAMYLSGIPTGGVLKVFNNLLDSYYSGTPYAIYLTSMTNGILFVSYNIFDSDFSYNLYGTSNDGTNVTATFGIDPLTGQPTSGAYTNAGHPDTKYYDHDLSRNDVGCYGGSMSARNFFPTGDANHNRVYMLNMPSSVYTGNPIKVKADCFDK